MARGAVGPFRQFFVRKKTAMSPKMRLVVKRKRDRKFSKMRTNPDRPAPRALLLDKVFTIPPFQDTD